MDKDGIMATRKTYSFPIYKLLATSQLKISEPNNSDIFIKSENNYSIEYNSKYEFSANCKDISTSNAKLILTTNTLGILLTDKYSSDLVPLYYKVKSKEIDKIQHLIGSDFLVEDDYIYHNIRDKLIDTMYSYPVLDLSLERVRQTEGIKIKRLKSNFKVTINSAGRKYSIKLKSSNVYNLEVYKDVLELSENIYLPLTTFTLTTKEEVIESFLDYNSLSEIPFSVSDEVEKQPYSDYLDRYSYQICESNLKFSTINTATYMYLTSSGYLLTPVKQDSLDWICTITRAPKVTEKYLNPYKDNIKTSLNLNKYNITSSIISFNETPYNKLNYMLNESDLLLGRVPYLSTETSVTYISNKLKDYDTIPITASLNSDTLSLISYLNIEKTTPRITDEYYNYEEVPT
jgi:hypothetical protein